MMELSAFGVEADDYPSITANLDFEQHSGRCHRSYYNPAYKDSIYYLSSETVCQAQELLQHTNLKSLKSTYSAGRITDLPTYTTVIRTTSQTFIIKDYGLAGEMPLQELYRLVYKLK